MNRRGLVVCLTGLLGTIPTLGFQNAVGAESVNMAGQIVREIRPSQTDPRIQNFDFDHLVIVNSGTRLDVPLVIFLPGTHGRPANATGLLRVVASQGYRVIGLEYADAVAATKACLLDSPYDCYERFRRQEVFGRAAAQADDDPNAIEPRLVHLLEYLNQRYPAEGWDSYLTVGRPAWSRIVVSGFSQGAGMAAYIAKRELVARVVLFSSPWDSNHGSGAPAPWLSRPSATPPESWFAEYHMHEETAAKIVRAYAALRIPRDHILIFNKSLPADLHVSGSDNPFHISTIKLLDYEPQWRVLFGSPP